MVCILYIVPKSKINAHGLFIGTIIRNALNNKPRQTLKLLIIIDHCSVDKSCEYVSG